MAQKPFDAGDPEQVKERETKAGQREKRIANGLALVLSHADSRLWLYDLLQAAGPFRDPFTGNSHTFYNCGQQAWARVLTAKMLEPDFIANYSRMMAENKE